MNSTIREMLLLRAIAIALCVHRSLFDSLCFSTLDARSDTGAAASPEEHFKIIFLIEIFIHC